MDIVRGFTTLPKISLPVGGRDDDVFADRLNYKYTTFILIISSFTITYKILQYDHIQCWVPAILARYEHYINIYCWISNTYYVSYKEQTSSLTSANKQERTVKYYQWVPLILLVLAFFFLIPRFIYRFLTKQSGIDMLNVADAAVSYMQVEKFDKRRKILTYLANTIHYYASSNRLKRIRNGFTGGSTQAAQSGANAGANTVQSTGKSTNPHLYDLICCHGKLNGSYLVVLYMIIKLLYIANTIAQLFLLNLFLGFDYNSQGFSLLKDVARNLMGTNDRMYPPTPSQQFTNQNPNSGSFDASNPFLNLDIQNNLYQESVAPLPLDISNGGSSTSGLIHRYFPRESACDFRIRMNVDSLVHNYTVQCVLPINLFNEQLFTLLWVWLWFICLVNCYDLINWILRLFPGSRYNFIRERIRLKHSENQVKRNLNTFIFDYLGSDGVFMLRILTLNASDTVTHDIVQFLWHNYTEGGRMLRGPGEVFNGMGDNRKGYMSPNARIQQRFAARPGSGNDKQSTNIDAIEHVDGGGGQDERYVHAEAI